MSAIDEFEEAREDFEALPIEVPGSTRPGPSDPSDQSGPSEPFELLETPA